MGRLEGQGSTQKGNFDADFLIKVVKEDRKRFSRRLNICIRGLPSSGDDEQSFLRLCQLHLDLDPTLIANSIVNVNRVGDTGCLKPRVLIVKLNCLNRRKIILRNSYKLKNFISCAGTNVWSGFFFYIFFFLSKKMERVGDLYKFFRFL